MRDRLLQKMRDVGGPDDSNVKEEAIGKVAWFRTLPMFFRMQDVVEQYCRQRSEAHKRWEEVDRKKIKPLSEKEPILKGPCIKNFDIVPIYNNQRKYIRIDCFTLEFRANKEAEWGRIFNMPKIHEMCNRESFESMK